MVFTIQGSNNKQLEDFFIKRTIYFKKYFRLKKYFGIDWMYNLPVLFVVKDLAVKRHTFGVSAPKWLKGWCGRQSEVFVLSQQLIYKEEGIKFTKKRHWALIEHELIHFFYKVITKTIRPRWLNEGLCQYLSGQLEWKNKYETFSQFLDFFDKDGTVVYTEAGWAVRYLLEKSGKDKLLKLFKKMRSKDFNQNKFAEMFESVYGAKLNYKFFNQA